MQTTVDGGNPANQLRLVVYPIAYRVSYIPGGCLRFQPSTVPSSPHSFSSVGISTNLQDQFLSRTIGFSACSDGPSPLGGDWWVFEVDISRQIIATSANLTLKSG